MEEQIAPAAHFQHQPGFVWVQKPQEAQHSTLDDQLSVVDVKNRGLDVRGLLAHRLGHFSEGDQGKAVENQSERRVEILQRLNNRNPVGCCAGENKLI